jgi:hypothetical protein
MATSKSKTAPTRASNEVHLDTMELVPGRKETTEEIISHLVKWLRPIVDEAVKGNDSAQRRVRDIHKLIRPELYKLPPPVARAMAIYRLMGELSRYVRPIRGGSFLRQRSYVRLTEDEGWQNFRNYQLAKLHLQRRKSQRLTLQSLAISIFLENAGNDGFDKMSLRSVERDLHAARLYNEKQERLGRPPDYLMLLSNGESIPFYQYTEEWKRRKSYTDK